MARRGYKLQEFVAHSSNVNCLTIGKKSCQRFVTGGDDHNVNLWTIGKPTSLMSLSGHASPVESVAFDSAELSVLAGASSGVVKMWYLEEAKMVRTLSGHKTKCTAVEFHPFGELFASGSMDANLKIWDIRKKECIHTYRGHTQGISTIKFSPDGRWVVSGGFDNIVKVWDLTAGKLLHDFKFHVGHIRSIKFHPIEFLLATGSADKTVKFWDLETFELIGSTRPEATELRAITFHPDGRALFAGLDGGLKVYSWEPMICHDSVDLGWLTLGDLCIHDGKLLACSYYKNSVGVWIADVPLNKPYGTDITPKQKDQVLWSSSLHFQKSRTSENIVASLERYPEQSMSPDYETIDIKNIYVDTGGKPESPPVCLKQISNLSIQKKSPPVNTQTKLNDQYSLVGHTDGPEGKNLLSSRRGTVTFTKTKRGMLLKPAHERRSSSNQLDFQTQTIVANAAASCNTTCSSMDSNFKTKDLVVSEVTKKSAHEKYSSITNVQERSELLAPRIPSDHRNSNESGNRIKEIGSVKSVNGVTVVPGRTRTLVEKFERREGLMGVGVQEINTSSQTLDSGKEINTSFQTPDVVKEVNASSLAPEMEKTSTLQFSLARKFERKDKLNDIGVQQTLTSTQTADDVREIKTSPQVPKTEKTPPLQFSLGRKFERKDELNAIGVQHTLTSAQTADDVREIKTSPQVPEIEKEPPLQFSLARKFERKDKLNDIGVQQTLTSTQTANDVREIKTSPQVPEIEKAPPFQISLVKKFERSEEINDIEVQEIKTSSTPDRLQEINTPSPVLEIEETSTLKVNCTSDNLHGRESQISLRELTSSEDRVAAEGLMESHDIFLSNLRSRMTKLQVVRHFWVQKDIKGAINALMKLPDHSVQTDVISVLSEKMDILTLDLLPLLLPVLIYLLDSKTERHVTASLEMLLKVVAVFYPVIQTTISAPRIVKVDLQAEQRLQRCNQCNIQIQKIQKILPLLVKKGGVTGKCAQELRMLFEQL